MQLNAICCYSCLTVHDVEEPHAGDCHGPIRTYPCARARRSAGQLVVDLVAHGSYLCCEGRVMRTRWIRCLDNHRFTGIAEDHVVVTIPFAANESDGTRKGERFQFSWWVATVIALPWTLWRRKLS